jgi:WD40 repeat protein
MFAGEKVSRVASHDDWVAFAADTRVSIYRFSDPTREFRRMEFPNRAKAVAFSPCGSFMAVAISTGQVEMLSLVDRDFRRVFGDHGSTVNHIVFSPRQGLSPIMITTGFSQTVQFWDSETEICIRAVDCGRGCAGMVLLPGNQEILVGTSYGELIVVGMDGIKRREHQMPLKVWLGVMTALENVGDAVAIGFVNGLIQLRKVDDLDHLVWESQCDVSAFTAPFAFSASPNGRYIAVAGLIHDCIIMSVATGKHLKSFNVAFARTITFTPDSTQVLISLHYENQIRRCDIFPEEKRRIAAFGSGMDTAKLMYRPEEVNHDFTRRLAEILFRFEE